MQTLLINGPEKGSKLIEINDVINTFKHFPDPTVVFIEHTQRPTPKYLKERTSATEKRKSAHKDTHTNAQPVSSKWLALIFI